MDGLNLIFNSLFKYVEHRLLLVDDVLETEEFSSTHGVFRFLA